LLNYKGDKCGEEESDESEDIRNKRSREREGDENVRSTN
jgi:hypothetical protein